jgi:phage terminase Nu1 subunit (DNA packaging protein)
MSRLTAAQRKALPARDFALPKTRQYPIQDQEHARYALSDMGHETAKVQQQIKERVNKRYPDLAQASHIIPEGHILDGRQPQK